MQLDLPIYLDYSATTPVDQRVAEKMIPFLTQYYGNPSSKSHSYGWGAEKAVATAREQVAALVKCRPNEIVWTSGATESNNLAIKGAAHAYKGRGHHLVTLKTEHASVLDSMRQLETEGYQVTYLDPEPNGLLDMEKFRAAIRPDTILASVMLVNNEIGVVQDINAIGEICNERGVLFHVDAAQATGKVDIDLSVVSVDLMSLSAHKTYGPKGIGALHVRNGVKIEPQIHGGGQQRGMRSGTLATHQIAGIGEAFEIACNEMQGESKRIASLRDRLHSGLLDIGDVSINGDISNGVPHILNVCFASVDNESLMLSMKDIALSSGSACTSGSMEPSHVLRAIGLSDEEANSSIRISLGRFTTFDEVDIALDRITNSAKRIRAI